jgi:hypothetical protein
MSRHGTQLATTALAALLFAGAAHAQAPADSTVEGYVKSMADSTDAWFGTSAEHPDLSGLDSARTWAEEHPGETPRRRSMRVSMLPLAGFSRTIGGAMGAEAMLGRARHEGLLSGSAMWTTGAGTWFGGGEYVKRWAPPEEDELGTRLALRAARDWDGLDRDFHDPVFAGLQAFLTGNDRSHYLRRDGVSADVTLRLPGAWAGVSARDQLESPMATTATWFLFGHLKHGIGNDSAAYGRVRELGARGSVTLGRLPYSLQGRVWTAGGALGGDLEYTRFRVALGGASALGRHLTLVPQAEYGRITGSVPPQDAFYLGGGSLRSLDYMALQGSGRALLRAELMTTDPVQRLLGIDSYPSFPIQLGVFGGLASVWGRDPVTGRAALTPDAFPSRHEWLAEAGLSVLYRPGLPDPDAYVRVDWGVPIGPDSRTSRVSLSYVRALNFLRRR